MTILLFRYLAFILLTLFTGYVDIAMYISLGSDVVSKFRLGGVMSSLVLVKTFALLRMETIKDIRANQKANFGTKTLAISAALYFSLAVLSVINTTAANLSAVDKQVSISKINSLSLSTDADYTIEENVKSLAQVNSKIDTLVKQLAGINPDFATGIAKISTELVKAEESRDSLLNKIDALKKQKSANIIEDSKVVEDSYNMFSLMSRITHVSSDAIMAFLMIVISVLAEVSLYFTSPTLKVPEKLLGKIIHGADNIEEKPEEIVAGLAVEKKVKKSYYKKKTPQPTIKQLVSAAADALVKPAVVSLEVSVPEVTAVAKQKVKPSLTKEQVLEKILTPIKGAQLKPISDIAYETGISIENLSYYLTRLSGVLGPNKVPIIYKKDASWYLNFNKSITMSLVKGAIK